MSNKIQSFAYNRGAVAFANSMKKFSDDKIFMEYFAELKGDASGFSAIRQAKQAAMEEWKRGYREAKEEAEKPVAKKTTKKKTTKKKTSKKKVSKKTSKK
jgi:hypothetical protein